MELFAEFISTYGVQIMYAILTALAGYIGIIVKNLYSKYINDQTKKDVVRIAVQGVEQMYKELHGEEKLEKALSAAEEMLTDRNIQITSFELRMLIEAAVAEFNNAFAK